jgi:hypothetical protein
MSAAVSCSECGIGDHLVTIDGGLCDECRRLDDMRDQWEENEATNTQAAGLPGWVAS